jgi:hypothetical protein
MNLEDKLLPNPLPPKCHADFLTRGFAAIEDTKRSGNGVPTELVMATLDAKLAMARQQLANVKNRHALGGPR